MVTDFVAQLTAGEALAANDAVYISDADGKVYKTDADDLTKMKFAGYAQEAAILNATVNIVTPGNIMTGFSGLTKNRAVYLSGTPGLISHTPGTNEYQVGIAVSATTVVVSPGVRRASGVTSFTTTTTTTITCGFRPSRVRVHAVSDSGNTSFSHGGWTASNGNSCIWLVPAAASDGGTDATKAWLVGNGSDVVTHRGVIDTVTETGFNLNNTEVSGPDGVYLSWEAEGDF